MCSGRRIESTTSTGERDWSGEGLLVATKKEETEGVQALTGENAYIDI